MAKFAYQQQFPAVPSIFVSVTPLTRLKLCGIHHLEFAIGDSLPQLQPEYRKLVS